MRFRVTLHKRLRRYYDDRPEPNPFLIRDIFSLPPVPMLCRSWEFEAKDEAEVRRLLKDAQDMGIDQVQGFTLRSIERLSESEGESL